MAKIFKIILRIAIFLGLSLLISCKEQPEPTKCTDILTQTQCNNYIDCVYKKAHAGKAASCENAPRNCHNILDKNSCNTTYGSSSDDKCEWDGSLCKKIGSTVFFGFKFNLALVKAVAKDGSKDMTAIGTNGEGSRLYYGTKTARGFISSIDPKNPAKPIHKLTRGPNEDGTAGSAVLRNGKIISIVAGPGKTAVASLAKVNTSNGGIIEMDEMYVNGAWNSEKGHLNIGVDDQNIKVLTVFGDNWIAFVDSIAAKGAASNKIGRRLSRASLIPVASTKQLVLAAASYKNDLFLAFNDATNGATVIKHTADKDNLADPPIDFDDTSKIIAKHNDMKIDPGTANKRISTMAVVGDYLLVGLKSRGPRKGGVAVINLIDNQKNKPMPDSWNIKRIAVSADARTGIAIAAEGLLFFYNGKLIKVVQADIAKYTEASADAARPIAFSNASPTGLDLTHVIDAVSIDDTWYLATDNEGIFPVEVKLSSK